PGLKVEQIEAVLKDEQAEVSVVELDARNAAIERPQRRPGGRRQRASIGGAGSQDVHERCLAVEPIPAATQEPAIAPPAMPQQAAGPGPVRRGPVVPIDALVKTIGQRLELPVLQELGRPKCPGQQPRGIHRAQMIETVNLSGGGIDEVWADAVIVW